MPDKLWARPFYMQITIRKTTEEDLAEVVGLIRDFAEYENLSEYFEVTEERLGAAMFGPAGFVEGLIATEGLKPVAFAIYYPSFSSFRGERGLYLEDIYIVAEYRRLNLGEKMLREIACLAGSRGMTRIDFQVLDWNTPARSFYFKHGAECSGDTRHFKFAGEAFARLATRF